MRLYFFVICLHIYSMLGESLRATFIFFAYLKIVNINYILKAVIMFLFLNDKRIDSKVSNATYKNKNW